MAGTPSIQAAIGFCVAANFVSAVVQIVRFYWRQKTWDALTWWSLIQAGCYVVGTVVTIALWQTVPRVSDRALQYLQGICWLNSFSGQLLIVYAIFENAERAGLVLKPAVLSCIMYIAGFGMMLSSSRKVMGTCFLLSSAFIFYTVLAIAVDSIFLNPQNRNVRSKIFIAIFTFAPVSIMAFAVAIAEGDYSSLLLVLSIVGSSIYFLLTMPQIPKWLLQWARYKSSPQSRMTQ